MKVQVEEVEPPTTENLLPETDHEYVPPEGAALDPSVKVLVIQKSLAPVMDNVPPLGQLTALVRCKFIHMSAIYTNKYLLS